MSFQEKYSTTAEANKTTISNDAYAIGEMIENLITALQKASRKL